MPAPPSNGWPSVPACPRRTIVLWGRSIGGAIAVQLAADPGARGLILERTFTSLPDVAACHYPWLPVRWLMHNRFDSLAQIGAYRGPLLQSHGTADEVVPFEQGQRLFEAAAASPKQFVAMPDVTHNGPNDEDYYTELQRFLDRLKSPGNVARRAAGRGRIVTLDMRKDQRMRIRYWLFAALAVCGLLLGSCNRGDNKPKPPSDATTDTPMLDIDEGLEVPADAVSPAKGAAQDAGAGGAAGRQVSHEEFACRISTVPASAR